MIKTAAYKHHPSPYLPTPAPPHPHQKIRKKTKSQTIEFIGVKLGIVKQEKEKGRAQINYRDLFLGARNLPAQRLITNPFTSLRHTSLPALLAKHFET